MPAGFLLSQRHLAPQRAVLISVLLSLLSPGTLRAHRGTVSREEAFALTDESRVRRWMVVVSAKGTREVAKAGAAAQLLADGRRLACGR